MLFVLRHDDAARSAQLFASITAIRQTLPHACCFECRVYVLNLSMPLPHGCVVRRHDALWTDLTADVPLRATHIALMTDQVDATSLEMSGFLRTARNARLAAGALP